ncbi:MAG TPA: response regulator [Pyrinomonadaceae bacterium]|nr:response regulator [Pyrinomonadaceae bacterium]
MMNLNEVEILLVEDNPNDAELTMRVLKKNHLANQVMHAKDGEEALEFIFAEGHFSDRNIENKPKVILLDLKLPKVNGIEVLERVKRDERTKKIPIVILTSSREDSDLQKCYSIGVNSYIVKPVDFDSFVKAVTDLGLYWLLLNEAQK